MDDDKNDENFDVTSQLWPEASSLLLNFMLPVEFIYGDWYWWLSVNEAKKARSSLTGMDVETGSRIEGFCIPQFFLSDKEDKLGSANLNSFVKWEPDLDIMKVKSHCFKAEDGLSCQSIFAVEHSPDDPRYVRLHLTEEFAKEFPRFNHTKYLHHAYLFPDGRLPFKDPRTDAKEWTYECHGPVRKLEKHGITSFEEDVAYVFTFPDAWPEPAMEWLVRAKSDRPFNWPSPDLVQEIYEQGCHIAPVGRGRRQSEPIELLEYARNPSAVVALKEEESEMDATEWRVSFSIAENKLGESVTPVQRQVMVLLKMLKKLYFEDLISTYHFKQLIFWQCEKKDASFWREDDLVHCVTYMLDMLAECLKDGKLPHYILRESNLLQNIDPNNLNKAYEIAVDLRKNILPRTVSMLRRLQSFTYLTHQYLDGVLYDEFVRNLRDGKLCKNERQQLKLEICKTFTQRCSNVIASILRGISDPEAGELLAIPLNAYESILARILCKNFTIKSCASFEDYLAEKELKNLVVDNEVLILSRDYQKQLSSDSDLSSLVPACKTIISIRNLRNKQASKMYEGIFATNDAFKVFALLKEEDFKNAEMKLTAQLKGQIDNVTYEDLNSKIIAELEALLKERLQENP